MTTTKMRSPLIFASRMGRGKAGGRGGVGGLFRLVRRGRCGPGFGFGRLLTNSFTLIAYEYILYLII